MIESICLVRLSALGDVMMCVPLVNALQRHFPAARLTWVISNPAYALVEGMPGIEFIVLDKPNGLLDYWRFKRRMRSRHFDVLLATQASFRANLLYACIRASRKIGYDRLRAKDGHGWFIHEAITPGRDHTLEGFLKFAHALGVHQPVVRWDLPVFDEERRWARQLLETASARVILINPAASKPERTWLVSRYIEVIEYARLQGFTTVVLTGGPSAADRQLGDMIAMAIPGVINVIGKTRPRQLLALMREVDLVICPDTGPSHMAAAVGTPVIALHAVTNADVSGPYPFLDLAINQYPRAVETVLGKTVVDCVWGTHVHGPETMRLVSVQDVTDRIDAVITRLSDNHSR